MKEETAETVTAPTPKDEEIEDEDEEYFVKEDASEFFKPDLDKVSEG